MACRILSSVFREAIAALTERRAKELSTSTEPSDIQMMKSFESIADRIRHPEKYKKQSSVVTISGKVNALRPGENVVQVVKQEGHSKQVIDSCTIQSDGTYEMKVTVRIRVCTSWIVNVDKKRQYGSVMRM